MKHLKHIWFYALKDLKIFHDATALRCSFLSSSPSCLSSCSTLSSRGWAARTQRLQLHLATQETAGGLSQQIIGAMETKDQSLLKPGDPVIIWDKDYNAASQPWTTARWTVLSVSRRTLRQSLMSGTGTKLEVYVNAGATNTRAALNGVAEAIASQIGTSKAVIHATIDLMVKNGVIANDPASIAKASQDLTG